MDKKAVYEDCASRKKDSRPGLDACLEALRERDTPRYVTARNNYRDVVRILEKAREWHPTGASLQELYEHVPATFTDVSQNDP